MTEPDLRYVQRLIAGGVIAGPVLELGADYGGQTCRDAIRNAGFEYYSSDVVQSPGVDFVANFEHRSSVEHAFETAERFGTILILNVLEHTFDPVAVLDNAARLLSGPGSLVVITPAVWTLHDYPIDCYRLLPHFYEQYASRRGMKLNADYFEFVELGRLRDHVDAEGRYRFPLPTQSRLKYWRSRVVQKLFNTYGRGMVFPCHVAIGAVLTKA